MRIRVKEDASGMVHMEKHIFDKTMNAVESAFFFIDRTINISEARSEKKGQDILNAMAADMQVHLVKLCENLATLKEALDASILPPLEDGKE